jgi:hypothetical protein
MSDKTIADKMYLKTAKSLAVFNGQANPAIVAQLPAELMPGAEVEREGEDEAGGEAAGEVADKVDVVLVIALNQSDLDQYWEPALQRLGEKGSLWIAYMKQSAPKATDLNKEVIYDYASARGVTGVALISMDADWSAVRLKRI